MRTQQRAADMTFCTANRLNVPLTGWRVSCNSVFPCEDLDSKI